MAFRVKQTAQADYDLDRILEWLLARQAGDAGLRWFHRFKETIHSLSEMPERRMLAPENAEFPFEVRQLLFGQKPHQYRVLFTIQGERSYCPSYSARSAQAARRATGLSQTTGMRVECGLVTTSFAFFSLAFQINRLSLSVFAC